MPSPLPASELRKLLYGPYRSPKVRIGDRVICAIRGSMTVCDFSGGRIRWPLGRVGHGGKGAYVVFADLARAVPLESCFAIHYWWGVGTTTVSNWRRHMRVPENNPGTRRLHSLLQPICLATRVYERGIPIDAERLRFYREQMGWSQLDVIEKWGTHTASNYYAWESGKVPRVAERSLIRLAEVFGCRPEDLAVNPQEAREHLAAFQEKLRVNPDFKWPGERIKK